MIAIGGKFSAARSAQKYRLKTSDVTILCVRFSRTEASVVTLLPCTLAHIDILPYSNSQYCCRCRLIRHSECSEHLALERYATKNWLQGLMATSSEARLQTSHIQQFCSQSAQGYSILRLEGQQTVMP